MSNIMDIARSAIGAYRTALGVTGENIANVNTEGYRRRDVTTSQIGGAQTTVTTLSTGGQGVEVNQIRRAFDALLAERLRTTAGDVSAADVHLAATKAVETQLLPNTGGIDAALEDFFAAMGSLASSPADTSLRRVTLESGRTLASAFQGIAAGLMRLRDDTMAEADLTAQTATNTLRALNELQQRFSGNTGTVGALNPLHDERDRMLSELADAVGIAVDLDPLGRARITLGSAGGGPELLGTKGPAVLTVSGETDLTLTIARDGATRDSRMIGSGKLGGYVTALGAIDAALQEINALARKMAGEMNAVHAAGLDLTGAPGGDMFSLDGWVMTRAAGNQGYARAAVTPNGPAQTGPITLIRDATLGVWRAEDASGTVLGSADRLLVLPGVTIEIEGEPANGDRLTFTPTHGLAANMRFLPEVPERLAAAVSTLVAPAAGNTGSATVSMAPTTVAVPPVPLLSSILEGADTAAGAVTLLNAGVVGYIPAGTTRVDLASLGAQATADLALSDAESATTTSLSLTLDGTTHVFDLTTLADGTPRPAGMTSAALAAALTAGQFLTATGDSFASLGLAAAGAAGSLSLSRATGNFDTVTLSGTALSRSATLTAAAPQGGTLHLFTREGRQISGTPMAAADIAMLFTQANGFLPGAQYVTDYLNAATGTAYRGLTLDLAQGTGLQGLTLTPHPVTAWAGPAEAPASPARSLSLETGAGLPITLTLPQGSNAARLASMVAGAVPGLRIETETVATLTVPDDGRVEFALEGNNTTPLIVTGDVAGGRLDALLLAVNALSGTTGITAELAPRGDRLLLRNADGADIRITGLIHRAGGTMQVQSADHLGQPIGSSVTLGAGQDGVRLSGQVTLHRETLFTATLGGVRQDSTADALQGGLVTRATTAAGAKGTLTFNFDPALDPTNAAADGRAATAGPTRYSVTLGGRSVSLDSAAATSASDVARGLAAALRDGMPTAALTGGPVAQRPAEGASTLVSLDGQDYVLRMIGGAVQVTGPEDGRLSASFGPDNRLRLAVTGGSTDAAFIALPSSASGTAFGLSAAQSPISRLTGQPLDPAALPATLLVDIGGTAHSIAVTAGPSLTLPPGFPGSASLDATGAISLDILAHAGPARILPGSDAAGFATLGTALSQTDATLALATADGTPLAADVATSALAGQRLSLTNLPPEDLIVVMTGSGSLRLTGQVHSGPPPVDGAAPAIAPVELRVLDATSRRVGLFDLATGHSIGTRVLDTTGGAVIDGLSIAISGNAATGDAFRLTPNSDGRNDGRALDAILALRFPDVASGKGGFARILSDLQSEVGTRAAAADQKRSATAAIHDTVRRADAEQGAVDLDREAARLLELQQSYQASAQIMSVAKELFDTLLNAI